MNYIVVIIAIILIVAYWYTHRKISDANIPAPATERHDLLFGYYGCVGDQVRETAGCVNILWECQFGGPDEAATNIFTAKMPTVLDLANQLFEKFQPAGRNYRFRVDAESRLMGLFKFMQANGSLSYVKGLVPMDEPNTNVQSDVDLMAAINTIRKVAAQFPELQDSKLVCIYAAKPDVYPCIKEFDWVGFDDYDMKSQIFVNGQYANLVKQKRPDAQTILLPGGAFGQDLTPFLNFAHSNMEVGAIVAFTWFGPREAADTWVGIGSEANPRRLQYVNEGRKLIGG